MKPDKLLLLLLLLFCGSCSQTTAPSSRNPIIVITFDDQHQTIYSTAFPLLHAYGYPATSFINTDLIGLDHNLTWPQVIELETVFGWETGGHTLHHVNLPYCDAATVHLEVGQDKQNLLDHGLNPHSFALPSGHATSYQFEIIAHYYDNIRTSQNLYHTMPVNRRYLGYFSYESTFSADHAIGRIIRGIQQEEAVIIIGFHRVCDDLSSHPNVCTPQDFEKILRFVHDAGLQVLHLQQAMSQLCGN
jgi:peptidoglycan/xylan/chitin deacetylase (PgdA/CDA1 family)